LSPRRKEGDETWFRLREWTKGSKAAERLSYHVLRSEGYTSLDPSHPLGGRDGAKDVICKKDDNLWIGAVYFPRGQKTFRSIKNKFEGDLKGVDTHGAEGFAFITNQEITVTQRKELMALKDCKIEVYHLERIATILDNPINLGIRLEYLEIPITLEEQVAYYAERDKNMMTQFDQFNESIQSLQNLLQKQNVEENDFIFENRSEKEIADAIEQLLDTIWYDRHLSLKYRVQNQGEHVNLEIWKGALNSAKKVVEKYGRENLGPWTDFEWGMLNGKLSALRWIVGEDWDMLDT